MILACALFSNALIATDGLFATLGVCRQMVVKWPLSPGLGGLELEGRREQLMKMTHKPTLDIVVNPLAEKGLTPMQERFARHYATSDGITQTEAARRAGYSENSVGVLGHQLMKNPHVLARIEELKSELAHKFEVTFENHIRKLAEIRDMALDVGNFMAAVSAEKGRGQVAGLYIDRKEIMIGRMDQMSREEVLKEIQRMQKEYPILAPADKVLTLEATVIKDATDTVITEEENDEEAGTEALG